MPFVIALISGFASAALPILVRLLVGIGVSTVTYVGIKALWDSAQSYIWSSLGATSSSILTLLGMAKVDQGIQIILSAGSALLVIKGVNAATDSFAKFKMTPK